MFAKSSTKGPSSIYYIYMQFYDDSSNFTNLRATRHFSKNSKFHKISNRKSIFMNMDIMV